MQSSYIVITKLKKLICDDRDGDWKTHLHAVQEFIPVFRESGRINHLRYGSWYIEKMRLLLKEYPHIYHHFISFVAQTPGNFWAFFPDKKLEQNIQRSKESKKKY